MRDTCMLGDVAIRQMHIWEEFFGLFIDAPSDHAHVCRITNLPGLPLNLVLLVSAVKVIVAHPAQRHQIIGAIPSGLA